jgi:hypothetical protein
LTFNAPPSEFTPLVDGLSLRLDNSTVINLAPEDFKATKKADVFTIKNSAAKISGTLRAFKGGSSRNEIVLSSKFAFTGSFDFNDTTTVRLTYGLFNEAVALNNNAKTNSVSYNAKKNFALTRVLYVDGVITKVNADQINKDSVRLVATFEGPTTGYNPDTDTLVLDIGQFQVSVGPGKLVSNAAKTKAKGSIDIAGGKAAAFRTPRSLACSLVTSTSPTSSPSKRR